MKRRVRAGGAIFSSVMSFLQSARDFEDGDATAGVVVGAGSLMVEMATESDLFVF